MQALSNQQLFDVLDQLTFVGVESLDVPGKASNDDIDRLIELKYQILFAADDALAHLIRIAKADVMNPEPEQVTIKHNSDGEVIAYRVDCGKRIKALGNLIDLLGENVC